VLLPLLNLTSPWHRGRADEAHERVRKWTSRVDLFQKDFIIIPVNQSLHWTLAIVCYPGEAERAARVGTGAAGDALEARALVLPPRVLL
jgi:Ulp1 family protease